MSEDDFYTPTDLEKLRMENELLTFEVRFLRTRLGWAGKGPGSSVSLNRLARLEEAETDLVLLVGRLARSPLGPLLRLRRSFRTLEQRYVLSPVTPDTSSPEARLAYLEQAEQDLVLLLRRLGTSPLGPLLRRRRSFQTLEQRYL